MRALRCLRSVSASSLPATGGYARESGWRSRAAAWQAGAAWPTSNQQHQVISAPQLCCCERLLSPCLPRPQPAMRAPSPRCAAPDGPCSRVRARGCRLGAWRPQASIVQVSGEVSRMISPLLALQGARQGSRSARRHFQGFAGGASSCAWPASAVGSGGPSLSGQSKGIPGATFTQRCTLRPSGAWPRRLGGSWSAILTWQNLPRCFPSEDGVASSLCCLLLWCNLFPIGGWSREQPVLLWCNLSCELPTLYRRLA